jgi:phospholipid/cholesterol/gamma-HCH transport system permease protein
LISPSAPPGLILEGKLKFAEAAPLWTRVSKRLESVARGETIHFDMSLVESVDGGTMALLVHLRNELKLRGVRSDFVGAAGSVQELVHLYGGDENPIRRKRRRARKSLDEIGERTLAFFRSCQEVFAFLGDMILALLGCCASRGPPTGKRCRTDGANWRRRGADRGVINFLVGFVMAFQGAGTQTIRCKSLVADLVGLSVTRELGPLMTAIIVCGPIRSRVCRRLGTMKVSEKSTRCAPWASGLSVTWFLPRALAVMVVSPCSRCSPTMVGIGGGLLVGVLSLDLSVSAYLSETHKALSFGHFFWRSEERRLRAGDLANFLSARLCDDGRSRGRGAAHHVIGGRDSVLADLDRTQVFTVFFYSFHL